MFLPRQECLGLLATVPIGRVGVTMNALPVVLPVNFAVFDGDIVFRTVDGTKFHAAVAGTVVAFEVDSYDSEGTSGWSVVIRRRLAGRDRPLRTGPGAPPDRRLVGRRWQLRPDGAHHRQHHQRTKVRATLFTASPG